MRYSCIFSKIDGDISIPCENGDTCVHFVNSYECTCMLGYEWVDCHSNNIYDTVIFFEIYYKTS